MRADLIERLRAHQLKTGLAFMGDDAVYSWADKADELLTEAADALASQEPVAFIQRDTLEVLRKDKHAMTVVCSGLLTKPFGDLVPLFTSPVVPVAAKAEADAVFEIEHDGFRGTKQGSYVTREGKRGVVLQQIGTKVVHVYGEKWLTPPAPTRKGEGL